MDEGKKDAFTLGRIGLSFMRNVAIWPGLTSFGFRVTFSEIKK